MFVSPSPIQAAISGSEISVQNDKEITAGYAFFDRSNQKWHSIE